MKKEKKYKRGDVREDGMVFFCYDKTHSSGERWVTRNKMEEIQLSREEQDVLRKQKFDAIKKQLKRGDTRSGDNLIFWAYNYKAKNFQQWLTPSNFKKKLRAINKTKERNRQAYKSHIRNHARGDIRREDNKIFWNYNISCPNYEEWVTPKQFAKYKKARKSVSYLKTRSTYESTRRSNDTLYKLKTNIRTLINKSLRDEGYSKKSKTNKILGCNYQELLSHIESQFTRGMTWDNAGEWHIDHRLPLAAATTENEVIKLNHYTNLQPMWATKNIRKGDKHDPAELKAYLAA